MYQKFGVKFCAYTPEFTILSLNKFSLNQDLQIKLFLH